MKELRFMLEKWVIGQSQGESAGCDGHSGQIPPLKLGMNNQQDKDVMGSLK